MKVQIKIFFKKYFNIQQTRYNVELNQAILIFTYFTYEQFAASTCAGQSLVGFSMENHMEISTNIFKLLCIVCIRFPHYDNQAAIQNQLLI